MKANKAFRGIAWWAGAAASTTIGLAACGSDFSSDDCKASRTCALGGATAEGGESAKGGRGGHGGLGEGGADAPMANGGDEPASSTGGDGTVASVGGAGPECTEPADCSNGDPSDGEEVCEKGVCATGNPPPTVIAVTPADKTVTAEPEAQVVVEFSEPLDAATVTSTTVKISDGIADVPGKLHYANRKATFTPDAPFALGGTYVVSVSTGVTDEAGAPLLNQATSAFSIRDGAWTTIDVVNAELQDMATAGITSAGNVLVSWMSTGNPCSVSAQWFQKGVAAAPAKILNSPTDKLCSFVNAAANAQGVASVIWKATDTRTNLFNRQYRGGAWADSALPQAVSDFGSGGSLAVAPNGAVTFLQYGGQLSGWTTDAAGAWTAEPTVISTNIIEPSVGFAFDLQGSGLALWPESDGYNFERIAASKLSPATGKWAAATELPSSGVSGVSVMQTRGAPAVAVDSNGDAMAVWVNASSGSKLMASRYTAKMGWAEPESIAGNLSVKPLFERPGLVFDGREFVAAFTATEAGKLYTYTVRYDLKTGWDAYEKRQTAATDGTSLARTPRLVTDGHGNLLLVWAKGAAPTFTLVYQRYLAHTWGAITAIPGGTITSETFETAGEALTASMAASGLASVSWSNRGASGFISALRLAQFY